VKKKGIATLGSDYYKRPISESILNFTFWIYKSTFAPSPFPTCFFILQQGRRIEKSLCSLVQTRNEIKNWLQFLRERRLSFFQGVLKIVVLINYEDEDDL